MMYFLLLCVFLLQNQEQTCEQLLQKFHAKFKASSKNDAEIRRVYLELKDAVKEKDLDGVEKFACEPETKEFRYLWIRLLAENKRMDAAAAVTVLAISENKLNVWKWWEYTFREEQSEYETFTTSFVDALLRQFEKGNVTQKEVITGLFFRGEKEASLGIDEFKKAIGYKNISTTEAQRKEREPVVKFKAIVNDALRVSRMKELKVYLENLTNSNARVAEISSEAFLRFTLSDDTLEFARYLKEIGETNLVQKQFLQIKDQSFRAHLAYMAALFPKKPNGKLCEQMLNEKIELASDAGPILSGYMITNFDKCFELMKKMSKENPDQFSRVFIHVSGELSRMPVILVSRDNFQKLLLLGFTNEVANDISVDRASRLEIWELTPKVIELSNTPEFQKPGIKQRSVIRYFLECPKENHPQAAERLEQLRKSDPETVKNLEEIIKEEKRK